MAGIAVLIEYAMIIGVISFVAYFVIKKAVKDAIIEANKQSK